MRFFCKFRKNAVLWPNSYVVSESTCFFPGTGKTQINLICLYSLVPQILPKYFICPTHPTPPQGHSAAFGVGGVGRAGPLPSRLRVWGKGLGGHRPAGLVLPLAGTCCSATSRGAQAWVWPGGRAGFGQAQACVLVEWWIRSLLFSKLLKHSWLFLCSSFFWGRKKLELAALITIDSVEVAWYSKRHWWKYIVFLVSRSCILLKKNNQCKKICIRVNIWAYNFLSKWNLLQAQITQSLIWCNEFSLFWNGCSCRIVMGSCRTGGG